MPVRSHEPRRFRQGVVEACVLALLVLVLAGIAQAAVALRLDARRIDAARRERRALTRALEDLFAQASEERRAAGHSRTLLGRGHEARRTVTVTARTLDGGILAGPLVLGPAAYAGRMPAPEASTLPAISLTTPQRQRLASDLDLLGLSPQAISRLVHRLERCQSPTAAGPTVDGP